MDYRTRVIFLRVLGDVILVAGILCAICPSAAHADSIEFVENQPFDYEYAPLTTIPAGFGSGEFTFEMWLKPDNSFPVGSFIEGEPKQLTDWYADDPVPYSSSAWWFRGNFLITGHNDAIFEDGTFSVQMFGAGRVRWLFGDGSSAGNGGVRTIQPQPATSGKSLLDGRWHRVTLVRRWSGATDATLELWVDGVLEDAETSPVRTDMRTYWDTWAGFPIAGWYFGAEKQAAAGTLAQYEDYKGLLDDMRFYSRALDDTEIAQDAASSTGLVAEFTFSEGTGTTTCNDLGGTPCMQLVNFDSPWNREDADTTGGGAGGGGGRGGGGGGCFIATAAYGTPLYKELDTLRALRDRRLLTNAAGGAFVDAYYRISPAIAAYVATHDAAAISIREPLAIFIALVKLDPATSAAVMFGGALILITVFVARRRYSAHS